MKQFRSILVSILWISALIGCSMTDDDASKNSTIRVGVVAPLSGDNAHYGEILKNGFNLAFANEPKMSLKYEDSRFSQVGSISAINKLIYTDKIKVVLGEVTSGNTMAIAPIAEKNKVILFATIASADTLRYFGDYIFRNMPGNKIQGVTAADFLYSNLKVKSVAVFGQKSEYGVDLSRSFKNKYIKLGGTIKFDDSYYEGDKDFRTVLLKIKQSGAKALFIPGNENEPAIILKQAKEMNLNIPIIGGDGSSTDNLIKMAGNSSEGFYCTNVLVNKSTDYYKNYRDLFFNKYHKEPGAYDAYAYEGAKIIIDALKRVGNNPDNIKKYLYAHTFSSMTGDLKFDKDGEVNRTWGVYQVINGEFKEIK